MNLAVSLVVTSALFASAAEALVPAESDHLTPTTAGQTPQFHRLVVRKLGITPFNCGRGLLLPSSGPEASVSVYSISRNGKKTYQITSLSVEKSLLHQTDEGREAQRAVSVAVRRIDAEIPKQTAELVREIWINMIRNARPVHAPRGSIIVDATIAEFSIEQSKGKTMIAELNFSLSFPGKKTKQLVDIWNLLFDYCKETPEARPAIAKKIDQKAMRLIRTLKTGPSRQAGNIGVKLGLP